MKIENIFWNVEYNANLINLIDLFISNGWIILLNVQEIILTTFSLKDISSRHSNTYFVFFFLLYAAQGSVLILCWVFCIPGWVCMCVVYVLYSFCFFSIFSLIQNRPPLKIVLSER